MSTPARHLRIRDITLDTRLFDDGRRVEAIASWNGLRSVWCRINELEDEPLPSGEVAQCQQLAIRMKRILAMQPRTSEVALAEDDRLRRRS